MIFWRTFQTPLFCGGVLYGLQNTATGQIIFYAMAGGVPAGWNIRAQSYAEARSGESGVLLKPDYAKRTVFDIFLADVRMLSKANVPPELMQAAVADMIDRWNRRTGTMDSIVPG